MAGLGVCGLIFYLLVPVPEDYRYLIFTLQAVAVLAGGGVQVMLDHLPASRPMLRRVLAPVAMAAAFAWMIAATAHVPAKPDPGYHRLVADGLLYGNEVVLIAANATDEGSLIVEASLADPTRQHFVLRGSKALAESDWSLNRFRLLYATTPEVLQSFDRENVSMLLVRDDSRLGEVVQLHGILAHGAPGWERVQVTFPVAGISIYRRVPAANQKF